MANLGSRIEKIERRAATMTRPRLVSVVNHGDDPEGAGSTGEPVIAVATGVPPLQEEHPVRPVKVVGRVNLHFEPRAWQRAVLESRRRFSCIAAHRRAGKSILSIMILIHEALTEWRFAPRLCYLSPYLKQSRTIVWGLLKSLVLRLPGVAVSETNFEALFPGGAIIRLAGGDIPDALRGNYFDLAILDEYAAMRPELLPEVVRPAIADRSGQLFVISTPSGADSFASLYHAARTDDAWCAMRFSYQDTDALRPEEVEQARRMMSLNAFQREFESSFTASASDSMIPIETVDEARRREVVNDSYAPIVAGLDVGRFGDDETVLAIRQGRDARSWPWLFLKGLDTMQVAARVAAVIEEFAWRGTPIARLFIDGVGIGSGVVDRLGSMGYRNIITEVNGGMKPRANDDCADWNAEMWVALKAWLDDSNVAIPDDRELVEQLASRRYFFTPQQKLRLEAKTDMRRRGVGSPDRADAIALTFGFRVAAAGLNARCRAPLKRYDWQHRSDHKYRPMKLR